MIFCRIVSIGDDIFEDTSKFVRIIRCSTDELIIKISKALVQIDERIVICIVFSIYDFFVNM